MASSVYPDRNGSIVAVTPPAGDAGAQGPPGMWAGVALAEVPEPAAVPAAVPAGAADCAEEFADPDGRAVLLRTGLAVAAGRVAEG